MYHYLPLTVDILICIIIFRLFSPPHEVPLYNAYIQHPNMYR